MVSGLKEKNKPDTDILYLSAQDMETTIEHHGFNHCALDTHTPCKCITPHSRPIGNTSTITWLFPNHSTKCQGKERGSFSTPIQGISSYWLRGEVSRSPQRRMTPFLVN